MRRADVATALLAGMIAAAVFLSTADANHEQDDTIADGYDYGYLWTYWTPYPNANASPTLRWKALDVGADPVPFREALLMIDVVKNKYEAMFSWALAVGGYPVFDFEGLPHDSSNADVKYARMDTDAQVSFLCGTSRLISGCFEIELHYFYAAQGREIVGRVSLIYGPVAFNGSNNVLATTFAHEWGHGFGLAHHGGCGYVMGPYGCTDQPVAADIATALDTVYGYD